MTDPGGAGQPPGRAWYVRAVDSDLQLFGAVLGVAASIVGSVLWWSRARVTGRRLARLPRTSIGEARSGSLVKVVGRARLGDRRLRAPLSGRPCACWEIVIEARPPDPLQHRVLFSEARATDFYLEDRSGRARVDMSRGGVLLVADMTVELADRDPRRDQVLSRFGLLNDRELSHMYCREAVVEEGETVLACGVGHWEADPLGVGGGYREAPQILVLSAPGRAAVVVSDDPTWGRGNGDGIEPRRTAAG